MKAVPPIADKMRAAFSKALSPYTRESASFPPHVVDTAIKDVLRAFGPTKI